MVTGSAGTEDAKHVLDEIGQEVYKEKVKNGEAKNYINELKGLLSLASTNSELNYTNDPCEFDYTTRLGANSERHPCGNRQTVRFSDEYGGQCTFNRIKDNETVDNKCGACAPYRRLHLCDYNLEKMDSTKIKDKNVLLAEVCLAAKHEAESLQGYYDRYEAEYHDLGSTICTVLARSFADIGDIIRGKDLYLGNDKENDKLERKLKKIFKKIHSGLSKNGAQTYYNDDTDKNYYKLREDWWTANRETVWKAITCSADRGNAYFRATCGESRSPSMAKNNCRCKKEDGRPDDQVPTYFDYVPQYLRWFEEWAEDFCRKKKKKLQDVKTNCLDETKGKYCSLNGYDCTKTKLAIGKYRMGNQCTKCFFACYPYEKWIEKQKEQFDKQKKIYDKEIKKYKNGASVSGRQKRGTSTTNYDGYESKFYKELQSNGYGSVDAFLEKLSKENVCTKITDEKEGKIDFKTVKSSGASGTNNENEGTFYRSKYCQPCPHCGMKKKDGGKWEPKKVDDKCKSGNLYKPNEGAIHTDINFLYSGDRHDDIEKKLNRFCDETNGSSDVVDGVSGTGVVAGSNSRSKELYQEWKCYKGEDVQKVKNGEDDDDDEENVEKVKAAGGLCILENKNKEESQSNPQKEPKEIQKTYNDFFNFWVAHMLKDSIYWRTKKIKGCLEKKNGNTCKKNKCNDKCKCYEKWVVQKEKEWKPIKQHFYTQEDIVKKEGPIVFTHDVVLEGVLQIEFLNEDSTQDNQNSMDSDEKQHLKKMLQETGVASGVGGTGDPNGKKTIMDKLIDYEKGEAKKCVENNPEKCEDTGGSRALNPRGPTDGRSDSPLAPAAATESENEEDDDDDADEEEEDEDHGGDDGAESEEETAKEATDTTTPPDVCKIVGTLFSDPTKFSDACALKYGPKAPTSWKCIPSGDNTTTISESAGPTRQRRDTDSAVTTTTSSDNKGGLCIPPRRRKLYVGKLHDWASGNTQAGGGETTKSQSQSQDETSSQDPSDKLRTAFIQSAAIETFFLWDRYKKENTKTQSGVGAQLQQPDGAGGSEQTPEQQLQSGTIPTDFLRQMFYTLGDYRDICVGKTPDGIDKVSASSSGKDKDGESDMQKIKKAIEKILSQNGDKLVHQNSGKDPKTLWQTFAPSIWEGMVCALTYKENSSGGEKGADGKKIDKLEGVKGEELFEKLKNANDYETVKLDDTSDTQTKTNNDQPLTLKNFVLRPPYFRYLEEWGESFCKKRTEMLGKIKGECVKSDGGRRTNCSGDGFECTKTGPNKDKNFKAFDCSSCAKYCRFYRKWIERKGKEFEKQEKIYNEQKENCKKESESAKRNKDDSTFSETIQSLPEAKDFLQKLGPCKTNNGKDDINFNEINKTFRPAENCKPCSQFTVKCNGNDNCTVDGTENKCKGTTETVITAKNIESMKTNTQEVVMRVSDNNPNGNEFNGLEACRGADIFKGIRNEQWKCGKFCDVDVCGLKKGDNNGKLDDKQIILISALFKRWLEYFFEDYNRIRKKLKPCMNDDKGSTFQNKCDEKCKCVKQWIEEKSKEWKTIRDRYLKPYESTDSPIYYNVRTFLEELLSQNEVKKATGYKELIQFDSSCHCNGAASSENGKPEKKDIVECLLQKLEKLGKKATSCPGKPSGDQTNCVQSSPLPDDEEPLEETEENTVEAPKICKNVLKTPQPEETDGTCEPAPPAEEKKDEKKEEQEEPRGTEDQNPPAPAPAAPPTKPAKTKESKKPKVPKPQQPRDDPWEPLKNAMLSSTIMWSVGIGFAAFTYFYLKKKTKASVGNLFQILQIPKSDYDIPTKLSPNRYIPYTSGKYRGKRYIYLEGDSGTDSGYTDHYSDITSSSESEYEELDINDIYPYKSPKYKTLIEVVLEPSGNNTTASGKNTPSDTQNDIQNDGIPSDIPNSDTPPPITDDEWNTLKHDFISNMLQNQPNDVPNDYKSGDIPLNTQPNTLYFNKPDEKPFITSIHDRDLYTGEEISYNINMSTNSMDDIPMSGKNGTYTGIDLINDSLSGEPINIYDELLKRKENELFGTNHVKHTTGTHNVTKPARDDPIHKQLDLFHTWLDRHRNMCEKWENHHERLAKLKEEWENETHSGNTHPSDSNKTLNTDVSIQIDMNNPKTTNEFTYVDSNPNQVDDTYVDSNPDNSSMDTILEDLDKYNEPYYDVQDDIYYDVNDETPSVEDIPMDHNKVDVPSKVQIEMDINTKLVKEKYPIADVWDI
ncbi:erythrocyte membrane protein 1 [Plasmodium falciparum IGH-CR14]|uniref:Erythrocyte membrane protein 1 n=2 Tax=Plasmodium falciparum TaxID=5833 RepID=A0A0L1I4J8_PLAFA|nr:erythrocyte membrane protein 1 [Plasmodium falciparum IGH-CR14]